MIKIIIILATFFLDRISKNYILDLQVSNIDIDYYVMPFLNIYLVWNTGIGFGFLSTESSLFYNLVSALVGVVIVILCYFTIISKVADKLIYAIIIGGAIGNFYDRLIFNAVPDFIDLHYDRYHWFTFNVADIFITLGIIIFLTNEFLKNK